MIIIIPGNTVCIQFFINLHPYCPTASFYIKLSFTLLLDSFTFYQTQITYQTPMVKEKKKDPYILYRQSRNVAPFVCKETLDRPV